MSGLKTVWKQFGIKMETKMSKRSNFQPVRSKEHLVFSFSIFLAFGWSEFGSSLYNMNVGKAWDREKEEGNSSRELLSVYLFVTVVYFDQLLGASCPQKLVQLLFFSRFQAFLLILNFTVISRLKSTKNVWKWTKKVFFYILLTPQRWSTYKSWLTP